MADDDRTMAAALAGMVEECGHEVAEIVYAGGMAVIRASHRVRPDVVLMDINMRGLNGLTVCHALRSRPASEQPRIVFVSGALPSEHPFVEKAKPDAYLPKPVRLTSLRKALDDLAPAWVSPASAQA